MMNVLFFLYCERLVMLQKKAVCMSSIEATQLLVSEIEKKKLILNPTDFRQAQKLNYLLKHSMEVRTAHSQTNKPAA